MKKISIVLGFISWFVISSNLAFAADLQQNMQILAKNYKAFNQTNSEKEALIALENMQVAAQNAKQEIPNTLHGLPETDIKVKGYQARLDQLLVGIEEGKALVQANKLAEAKVTGKQLVEIKNQGHTLYK